MRLDIRVPGAAANSQPCAAGTSSAAANGLTTHTSAARPQTHEAQRGGGAAGRDARGQAEPADQRALYADPREREHERGGGQRGDAPALAAAAPPGAPGRAGRRARRSARAGGSTATRAANGSAAAPTQPSQRATGRCRRRAPKKPSTAVSSGGSSSVPTSSRIAQSGSSRLTVTIPAGSSANGPPSPARATAASSAVIGAQRRAAERVDAVLGHLGVRRRPALARRLQQHGGQPGAARPRPARTTVSGSARRAHWPIAREPPGLHADLAPHRALERAPQAHRRRVLAVGPRHDPRLAGLAPGDVAEHDRGVDRAVGAVSAHARAPAGARAAARGRDEHERRGQLADLEHPRQLEQRRGARQLGQRGRAERVAVRDHDDPAAREARAARRPPSRAAACRATVALLGRAARDAEAVGAERLRHAVGERAVGVRAGRALGELLAQLAQQRVRPAAVEAGGRRTASSPRAGRSASEKAATNSAIRAGANAAR